MASRNLNLDRLGANTGNFKYCPVPLVIPQPRPQLHKGSNEMAWDVFQTPETVTSHAGSDPQVILVQAGPSLLLGRATSQETSLLEKLMSRSRIQTSCFPP